MRGRGHRHRYLKNVVSHYATKAGCIALWVREDSTSELLLRQFTPLQCSTMFPLKAPAALADGARQMLTDLRAVVKLPIDQHEAKLVELDEQLEALRGSVVDGHGLRLDGTILHLASGEQVWFDVSVVHIGLWAGLRATHRGCGVGVVRRRCRGQFRSLLPIWQPGRTAGYRQHHSTSSAATNAGDLESSSSLGASAPTPPDQAPAAAAWRARAR